MDVVVNLVTTSQPTPFPSLWWTEQVKSQNPGVQWLHTDSGITHGHMVYKRQTLAIGMGKKIKVTCHLYKNKIKFKD